MTRLSATRNFVPLMLALVGILALLRSRFPRNVKYCKGMPILGMLPRILVELFRLRLHDVMSAVFKEMGCMTFAVNFAGIGAVATVDPVNIKHVLMNNFDNYVKGSITYALVDLLGTGIFNVDGDQWLHQRKTSSKMFTKRQFDNHIWKVVQKNTVKLTEVLRRQAGETVDLFNFFNRFTLDTIGEIGFSRDIGSLEDPSSPFLKSFDYAQSAMMKRNFTSQTFPTWKVMKFFGLGWERELPKHLKQLRDYSDDIAAELVEKVQQGEDNSFVGLFVKDAEGQQLRARDPEAFRLYMRDMVLNFLIAGRDTTAQNLTWAVYELSQHPEVVAKAREEIGRVCVSGAISADDIANMPFCRAIMDESLRLHPSVPLDVKVAVAADVLPDGTRIPRGTILLYVPYAQGRCEALWGKDAESFRPERWLEMMHKPSPYEFVAFNAGKRECLGRRLAELEMTATIATFLRDFDFKLAVPVSEVRYDVQLTLGCSTGLPCVLAPRS